MRRRPLIPRVANPFSPGTGNPYSGGNPYTHKGDTKPVNSPPINTVEDKMDRAVDEGERQAKEGVRMHRTSTLSWQPVIGGGLYALTPERAQAYLSINETGDWSWWVDGPTGVEIGHGISPSVEAAMAESEQVLLDRQYTAKMQSVMSSILETNPDVDSRQAWRLARKAMKIIEEADRL